MARKRKVDNPPLLIREEIHRMIIELPDAEAGKLIKALTTYRFEGMMDELPPKLSGLFLALKAFADLDAESYLETCEMRSQVKKQWWDDQKAQEKAETTPIADTTTTKKDMDDAPHLIMQSDPINEYDDDDIFG